MTNIQLDANWVEVLRSTNLPTDAAAKRLMALELYREHAISSGKAAEMLSMDRFDFIRMASARGIPFFDMTEQELLDEMKVWETR